MWHREVRLRPTGATVDVLFLDTEVCMPLRNARQRQGNSSHGADSNPNPDQGFSVSNVTEAYDAQVFAAATLLSSLLVYNSMHVLHANELEYLDLLVRSTIH